MNSALEKRITGFYLRPKFKRMLNGEEVEEGVELELLEDGYVISTKSRKGRVEDLRGLQYYYLEAVIKNLGLENNWTESKDTTDRSEVLGVVNMFKIDILEKYGNGLQDIKITFLKSGYFFAESTFEAISNEALEKSRTILIDNTVYNLGCKEQCRAITFIDMLAVISQILE